MKRYFTAIILSVTFVPLTALSAEWRVYNNPEGTFYFEAPDEVHVTQQAGTRPDGITTRSNVYAYRDDKAGQAGCAATETQFGEGATIPENGAAAMATVFKAQLQNLHVQPDIDTGIVLDGQNGWRLEFKDLQGNSVAFRWFVTRGKLLQLVCVTPPNASTAETEELSRVTNSFHFSGH